MTAAQYKRIVLDLFSALQWNDVPAPQFPGDETAGPFLTNVVAPISPAVVDLTFVAAKAVAQRAAMQSEKLTGCRADAKCLNEFVARFARRAFRRPLTEADRSGLSSLLAKGPPNTPRGLELVLTAILSSPHFLYFVERADERNPARADSFSVATRLSLFIAGTIPDDQLLDAASSGELDDVNALAAHSFRMLKDDAAAKQLSSFSAQWLGLSSLDRLTKDPARYPFFSPEVRADFRREFESFVDTSIRRSDGRFETLMSAPFSFPSSATLRVYGLESPAGFLNGTPVSFDPAERRGILTLAPFLAVHAGPKLTSPTQRGLFIYREVLCEELGEPPEGVDLTPIGVDATGQQSRRGLVEAHAKNPQCVSCHRRIDPIGLAFEMFDAIGAVRTVDLDDGLPLDTSVVVSSGTDVDGAVTGAVPLIQKLATSNAAQGCFTTQLYRFAFGRLETPADTPELELLKQRFRESNGSIPDLMVALVTSDAFRSAPTAEMVR
jgi:Protein of unknown function (DUF1592)/Protein of unknown function (DUF1588)/Protein of unknown function (DUF1595)/Protein of unknown function (DUF1585)